MSNQNKLLKEVSIGATARSKPIQQELVALPSMHFIRSLGSKINIEQMLETQLESEVQKIEKSKDQIDNVTFDIPLLIRIFELVREGINSDVELHNLVERILSLKNNGVLTMSDYLDIAGKNTSEGNSITSANFVGNTQNESINTLKKLAGIR